MADLARVMAPGTTPAAPPPTRRLIACGITRRHDGRTLTVRATEAGVTGSIRPGGAR